MHNAADALTAVPLGVAFVADAGRRRVATPTGTAAQNLAGIAIVLAIAPSTALAAYEAISRLMCPRHVSDKVLQGTVRRAWLACREAVIDLLTDDLVLAVDAACADSLQDTDAVPARAATAYQLVRTRDGLDSRALYSK